LDDSLRLAQVAEAEGYQRFWMAEHHGSRTFMSSATSLLLGRAAEHTSTIRLGSGGVMLPNHSPLMVAEYYGTLATMYGDRFDLGLGRAPGTDPITARELGRGSPELNDFAADVLKLHTFLGGDVEDKEVGVSGAQASVLGISPRASQLHQRVHAIPGEGTHVPLWMLGSSTGGAQVAAALGLPFSFASHFAPNQLIQAIQVYRSHFDASAATAQVEKPTIMAGVNVMVAETQSEAEFQFTSYQHMKAALRFGSTGPLTPPKTRPVEDQQILRKGMVDTTGVVGTPTEVADTLQSLVETVGLDELIVTSYAFDPEVRRRSHELLAREWNRN